VWASLGIVAATVIGGRGSVAGVAIAAAALSAAPELLRSLRVWAPFAGAVALVVVPTLRPEGLGWLIDRPVRLPRISRRSRAPSEPGADAPARLSPAVTATAAMSASLRPLRLSVPRRHVLDVSGVSVRFGGLMALTDVDLRVGRNQIVGLIGPNGAGKTTLFNAVSGLVRPETGRVRYRGTELLELPAHARQGLGLARTFQQVGLCLPQSVMDNMLIAQHPFSGGGWLRTVGSLSTVATVPVRRRARQALELVGVDHLADARVGELPHVTQRLVELAAALATGPELVLLDEPASGLSPEEAAGFVERIRELREALKLSMLLIEHHLPVITRLADYVYVLAEGSVLAHGTPDAVQHDERVIVTYLGESPTERSRHVG
jgi:branched-chain amino acid transport system ATP-binding protein